MEQRDEQSGEDKTEEATEEKRNRYREEGNLASPKEIVSFISLLLFSLYFYFFSHTVFNDFSLLFKNAWYGFDPRKINESNILNILYRVVIPVFKSILTLFIIVLLLPTFSGLIITKFNFSVKKITFNIEKINITKGVMRIFGKNSLFEFLKIIIKVLIIGSVVYLFMKKNFYEFDTFYFLNVNTYQLRFERVIFTLLLFLCISFFIMSSAEYAFNYWKINKDMMMTKQEVKEEIKKFEGDQHVKSRRKRMARGFAMAKSIKNTNKATFVVTNPEHFSVAVRYVRGMNAPILVAKGQDFLAFKIREIAKKNEIIIVENKPLARTLYKTVKINQEVPSSLYGAIIEVIKYIYKIKGKYYFEKFEK